MTIQTIGQGTVTDRSTRRNDTGGVANVRANTLTNILLCDLLATPAPGWRFSHWVWEYDHEWVDYTRANPAAPWVAEDSGSSHWTTGFSLLNPLDHYTAGGRDYTFSDIDANADFLNYGPTANPGNNPSLPLEGNITEDYSPDDDGGVSFFTARNTWTWSNLVVTAVFERLTTNLIMRAASGTILRAASGPILRDA